MILDIMPIPLSQGLFALVDGEDYQLLNRWKWSAAKMGNTFYAFRQSGKWPNQQVVLMHRQILGLTKGDGRLTDHKNRCGLDNRKMNIRSCNRSQNQQNQTSNCGTSKYKGVVWNKTAKKWQAQITHNYQYIHLGCFNNEIEAAKTYDKKAKELFGEFAFVNF